MSNNTDKIKTEIAKEIHKIQAESAKLNDAHTEGISVLYLEWDELHQEMKDWYLAKADGVLAIPNLVVKADNQETPKIHYGSYCSTEQGEAKAYGFDLATSRMIKEGWIKCEPKENK